MQNVFGAVRLAKNSKTVHGNGYDSVFLRLQNGKPPFCWKTSATKGWYSSMTDYCWVVKSLGDRLD